MRSEIRGRISTSREKRIRGKKDRKHHTLKKIILDAWLTNYKKKLVGDKKRVEELWRTAKPILGLNIEREREKEIL